MRVRFLHESTELLRMEIVFASGESSGAEHLHPRQEERFHVLAGRARFRIAGVEREAGEGEEVAVPPQTVHAWWNPSEDEARVLVEFRPALRIAELFAGRGRHEDFPEEIVIVRGTG
jgi:quercetin dioxygenase-like cupin family protein